MYGDPNTEGAVLKALRWLKKTQQPNGSWKPSPISNTGLAILAYLAHGETPASKEFGPTVERALQFLIDSITMNKEGQPTFKGTDGTEYATLIATYALCEAYGMTRNPNTKIVAMQTLQRIVDNQSPTGGWDYHMNKKSTRDDMSYAGWALQAQLMAHSHLRYKGEGPLATPKLAHGHLAPGPVPRPLPQTGEGGQTWSPDLNLTTQHRRPSPPPALRHGACSLSRVLSTRHSVHVAVQRLPWAPA